MTSDIEVRRVDFGYFVRPGSETADGRARVEPVLGYLIDHPRAKLLLDTGMGAHPEVDAHYRPRRVELERALRTVGVQPDEVRLIANCHLHFDHCGGNPQLAGRPVLVQRAELAMIGEPDYTLPELVAVPGLNYEQLDGESEVLPGVFVIPTPGHTPGHQSVVVRRRDGVVIVAGQSHDTATQFAADALAARAHRDGHVGSESVVAPPEWVERLLAFDPAAIHFAHDHATWHP